MSTFERQFLIYHIQQKLKKHKDIDPYIADVTTHDQIKLEILNLKNNVQTLQTRIGAMSSSLRLIRDDLKKGLDTKPKK